MEIGLIFRESWRITTSCWKLWLVILVSLFVFIPSLILTGGVSGAAGLMVREYPLFGNDTFLWTGQLSPLSWLLILGLGLLMAVGSAAASWILQATAIRIAAAAADRAQVSIKDAVSLGRRRFANIFKLSVVFGLGLALLGLLPVLLLFVFGDSPGGSLLTGVVQTGLLPFNTILGVGVLLVLMAVALEDTSPGMGVRRAWLVFKTGWWGFVLVLAITFVLAVLPVLFLLPLLLIALFVILSQSSWLPLFFGALIIGPLVLFVSIFSSVFTLAMYTMIYRASVRLLGEHVSVLNAD
jgi:hypothetical protein